HYTRHPLMDLPPPYEDPRGVGKPPSYTDEPAPTPSAVSVCSADGTAPNVSSPLPPPLPSVSARLPSYSQLVAIPIPLSDEELARQKRLRLKRRIRSIAVFAVVGISLLAISLVLSLWSDCIFCN
ncbi:hypothetical protein PMAYCL1PPCAC_06381, partial [Pristionchus mayeri]